jgi:hypothetical protein
MSRIAVSAASLTSWLDSRTLVFGSGTLATLDTTLASVAGAVSMEGLTLDNIDPRLTAFLEIASMGCFSFKESQPDFEDWLRNHITSTGSK